MIEALVLTLRVAIVAVVLGLLPGVLLGVWFARSKSPFVLGVEALVMAPLVLPPVATGLVLLIAFSHLPYLQSLPFTWWAASVAAAVMALPLIVSSVRTAVRGVDPELEAVARTLGAGPFRVLRSITLPLSWRGIVAGGLLAFCKAIGEFGATMVVAGNIPGRTRTLALGIYTYSETGQDQMAMVFVGASALLAFAILLLARRIDRA
ncbi:MAG: ABC transporter permease subunit [Planctomycetota bacterium]|nr:ABC transporter permease subunit [Planctomycetota bacterium]